MGLEILMLGVALAADAFSVTISNILPLVTIGFLNICVCHFLWTFSLACTFAGYFVGALQQN